MGTSKTLNKVRIPNTKVPTETPAKSANPPVRMILVSPPNNNPAAAVPLPKMPIKGLFYNL